MAASIWGPQTPGVDVPAGPNTNVIPITDNVFDLGSPTYRFNDIYFGGTIYGGLFHFTPTGTIAATNVQAAIEETDTENRALTALLRADLANSADLALGDALIGTKRNLTGSVAESIHTWLERNNVVTPLGFGATGNGVADDTAAFTLMAATGKPIYLPAGFEWIISSPVTISGSMRGDGADDGQTTIRLTGTGRLIVGDEYARWSGIKFISSVASIKFIVCPYSSFSLENYRFVRDGGAASQIGLEVDASANSIYFVRTSKSKSNIDYPLSLIGVAPNVINACTFGTSTDDYVQSFQSAISINGTAAVDANTFAAYYETGTNIVSIVSGAMRQNRFKMVMDGVTRELSTTVTLEDMNLWEKLEGGVFTCSGTFPQNQLFVGYSSTKIRATQSVAQSIANASATTITYDTEVFDSWSEFIPGTGIFTAKTAGYYQVTAQALSESVAWDAGERWEAQLFKNGALYANGEYTVADAAITSKRSSKVSALVSMNGTTDTLEFKILHNQGAAVLLDTAASFNFIEIYKLV